MQLLLPSSILAREIRPLKERFTLSRIVFAAKKVARGLGIILPGAPENSEFVKIPLTSPQGAGRALFLIKIQEELVVPLLLRDKTDKVGVNMSPRNEAFIIAIERNLDMATRDIEKGAFESISLN